MRLSFKEVFSSRIPLPHIRTDPFITTLEEFSFKFILVPPNIANFDFGDAPASFGDTVSVSCIVSSGDFPIKFQWFFNNKPISEVAGISTVKLGKRNSVMNIDSVNGKHAGNYTCQASNSATTVNFTANLIVNGKTMSKRTEFSFYVEKILLLNNHFRPLYRPYTGTTGLSRNFIPLFRC